MNLHQAFRGALKRFQTSPPIPDFNRAFQDGAIMPGNRVMARRAVGVLDLPSGRLIACDPALVEEPLFDAALSPGQYPVILSIANIKGDKRVVCAMLQVLAETPTTWKPALRAGDKPDSRPGYGVDSATGCFMDAQTAAIWHPDAPGFYERVTEQLEDGHSETCCWGNVNFDTAQGQVNAVLFSSGYGDGFYRSYWGYSAGGDIACLVTDFGLLEGTIAL